MLGPVIGMTEGFRAHITVVTLAWTELHSLVSMYCYRERYIPKSCDWENQDVKHHFTPPRPCAQIDPALLIRFSL
jgi:hypothetical protein